MNHNAVIQKLDAYKKELEILKDKHHSTSTIEVSDIHSKIIMIIRRIYPNPKEIKQHLFSSFGIAFSNMPDSLIQKDYVDNINENIRAIDVIKEEFELFGLEDFNPVKKSESEIKIGNDKIGFFRKKKSN